MTQITDKILEDFAFSGEVENVLNYWELTREDGLGFDFDNGLDVYAITKDLTMDDFNTEVKAFNDFVDFDGSEKAIQDKAEELQEILKEYYEDNYLYMNDYQYEDYEVNKDLEDAFERFVANKYEEVDDFEHDYYIRVLITLSANSFNPEYLMNRRDEISSNK